MNQAGRAISKLLTQKVFSSLLDVPEEYASPMYYTQITLMRFTVLKFMSLREFNIDEWLGLRDCIFWIYIINEINNISPRKIDVPSLKLQITVKVKLAYKKM